MALVVPDLLPSRENVQKIQRERRQAERPIAYWEQKAAEVRSQPTLTQLDPGKTIDGENWAHRFVIAPDRAAEVSTFLMCGSNAARLLELSDAPLKYAPMFRKMPKRFLEIFTRGCNDAISSGSPVRLKGQSNGTTVGGSCTGRCSFRSGANLIFGTYNSLLTEPGTRSSRRLADPFVGSLLSLIREIQAEGIAAPGGIAAALNARGFRPVRGRS